MFFEFLIIIIIEEWVKNLNFVCEDKIILYWLYLFFNFGCYFVRNSMDFGIDYICVF